MNQSSELLTPVHELPFVLKRELLGYMHDKPIVQWVVVCSVNLWAAQGDTPEEALESFAANMRAGRQLSESGQPFDNRLHSRHRTETK